MRFNSIFIIVLSLQIGCRREVDINLPIKNDVIEPTVSVTLEQSVAETIGTCNFTLTPDPALNEGFEYRVTFASPINPTTFTASDITNSGSGGSTLLTWVIEDCGDDMNFKLTATSIIGDGTIIPRINAGRVQDLTNINNGTSTSLDNTVSFTKNWYQEAYIKASNNDPGDLFGNAVSIHGDTLAVGARNEDSNQNTITNGSTASADNSNAESGAVYVYKRSGAIWVQEAYIKATNSDAGDLMTETSYSLSINGDTLAVGATSEDSNQNTITNGPTASADNSLSGSGAVYVYRRTGSTWVQEAYIKASNSDAGDFFGRSVAVSGDTLVVSASDEDSNATVITNGTGSSTDNSSINSGALFVYKRTGSAWAQEAYIKASNSGTSDFLGINVVSLSGDTIAVEASTEDSNQTTITNGTGSSGNNSSTNSGAVYVYRRTGTTWAQEAYIKASNNNATDSFGTGLALNGNTIAVGAPFEDSNQTVITNGTGSSGDNSALNSGAVYIYKRTGTTWAQEAYIKASNSDANDNFGESLALSGDTIAVGAKRESSNQTTISNGTTSSADNSNSTSGAVYVYRRTGTTWAQESYIKAYNNEPNDTLGRIAISLHGDTLAVGAAFEDSNQNTITNGPTASADNSSIDSGAVYVYRNLSRLFDIHELYASATSNDVTLSWSKNNGSATGYFVAYQAGAVAPANCTSGTNIDVGDVNNHTEPALSAATTYSFRVCATDGTLFTEGATVIITTAP